MAQVNLLLNRASPWLDIDSYLPYAGKVVVKNKTARTISLRIPRWVRQAGGSEHAQRQPGQAPLAGAVSGVRCGFPAGCHHGRVPDGGEQRRLYRRLERHPHPGLDEVTQPLDQEPPASPGEYYVSANGKEQEPRPVFTMRFRGNDLVEISPREEGLGYPLYRREQYKQDQRAHEDGAAHRLGAGH